ncbi:AABR07009834.1 [Phodopus roborovskii]|uniref:AABR07009834.1 protein n=1 Tax=Phodopus roborovskii TaxID=109678 RepID=A0AAU9ZDB6_PHORO|nr:AABR07009834.1 [Phodopus roborovskii]
MFLTTSQHTVSNICAEVCVYLVQVDFCKHGRLWYPGVAKWYLCCASCFNLPRFVCLCFSVRHSSVISRRHIES